MQFCHVMEKFVYFTFKFLVQGSKWRITMGENYPRHISVLLLAMLELNTQRTLLYDPRFHFILRKWGYSYTHVLAVVISIHVMKLPFQTCFIKIDQFFFTLSAWWEATVIPHEPHIFSINLLTEKTNLALVCVLFGCTISIYFIKFFLPGVSQSSTFP